MMALLCTLGVAGAATAGVTVAFVEPNRFTDMPFSPWEKDVVLKDLDQIPGQTGHQVPARGQELAIEILDIDLAGTHPPGHRARHPRADRPAPTGP